MIAASRQGSTALSRAAARIVSAWPSTWWTPTRPHTCRATIGPSNHSATAIATDPTTTRNSQRPPRFPPLPRRPPSPASHPFPRPIGARSTPRRPSLRARVADRLAAQRLDPAGAAGPARRRRAEVAAEHPAELAPRALDEVGLLPVEHDRQEKPRLARARVVERLARRRGERRALARRAEPGE